ncbi:FAD/NAD(P)-binding domain-containing protein [Aspergillus sclerotioniger CBS 115572]|uniref:FAD/NAD(P)-binding domain-containing protein n=1 Tax=Aspergillus sclerotioniger CBS 115572 TaxID=1450535 RepID=A0A317W6J5_9EURO|nr:FAD/NAD(P)-binding domain-containing protein [Aspergillus sclerotioniger CBS 115572]PWY80877.1 FAD/NAD(P)-binding domain-containing protein [Aspergillus sclerotioniger CBS 115572]
MSSLKILITGAGIAGTTLAYFLSQLPQSHSITVLERSPILRATGLQIDLRGPGIQVLRAMGLEEEFRAISVPEQGLGLVDGKGRRWGYFPVKMGATGKGLQSFTTEWEVMRGDLTRMIYGESFREGNVRYVFGVWVEGIQEMGEGDGVEVVFSDGRKERFDLVIGADGLGSKTRGLMLGVDGDGRVGVHELGVYAGYLTVKKEMKEGEGYDAMAYIATKGRGIMTRRHEKNRYLAYLFCRAEGGELQRGRKGDFEKEKQVLTKAFRGAGWQTEEILRGMDEADDFYCERMGVVNLDRWSRGRVVLVGDAAYCPSAMTGMGTSCAMTGAYVLAGEIGRVCGRGARVTKDDIETALARYEEKMRPFMNHVQRGLLDNNDYMGKFPSSAFGVGVMYVLFAVVSFLRLDVLAKWVLREDTNGWELPEYPELMRK